jgi:hypothetical protein
MIDHWIIKENIVKKKRRWDAAFIVSNLMSVFLGLFIIDNLLEILGGYGNATERKNN